MTDAPQLSLFYKILIYVEDKGQATIRDLEQLGTLRQMLGALGRLEGLRYIERTKSDSGDVFTLTDAGDTVLADLLSYLPTNGATWDGKWRIILFDIPESQRTLRQMFRLKLMDLGVRMLQSSVWITPKKQSAERFIDLVNEHKMHNRVYMFEATDISLGNINISELWNLPALEKEYEALFAWLKKEVARLPKSKNASFDAKCLIVALALTSKKDPLLPKELMPKNWIGYQSQDWYQKLRQFCT